MRLTSALVFLLAAPSCIEQTSRSPARGEPILSIQGPQSLQQGQVDRLQVKPYQSATADTVRWRSIPNRVVAVDSTGTITAAALGSAVLVAEVGGVQAYHMVTVTPDLRPVRNRVDGAWTGDYKLTGCERLGGKGPNICRSTIGAVQTFQLSLSEGGNTLRGRLSLGELSGVVLGEREFTGKSILDGALLSTRPSEQAAPPERAELTRWDVDFVVPHNRLKGTFEYLQLFTNQWGYQVYLLQAEIGDAAKR